MEKVNCECRLQVFQAFRERIGQPGKSTHLHSHRQILTFYVAGGDILLLGLAGDYLLRDSYYVCRAVSVLTILARFRAILLVNLPVVDLPAEYSINALSVALECICAQLEACLDAGREFHHKACGHTRSPLANPEGWHELGVSINGDENILIAEILIISGLQLFLFFLYECPDFIDLQILDLEPLHLPIHDLAGLFPGIEE